MAEHKHGTMDTTAQEKTFAGFIRFASWTVGVVIFLVVFMALANA